MAISKVPDPVLDTRNGDLITAQGISALPNELSDRSNSNPAVVVLEAGGAIYDKDLANINAWPKAALQKLGALAGIAMKTAAAATVTQTFTLSAPKNLDTVIASGTQISTADGSVIFATSSDLTIAAYTTPAGTAALTAGSPTVTGAGTAFPVDGSWNGYQIRIPALSGTWYTIASVSTATSLTLTTNAASTVATSAFNVGAITGTVSAKATSTGSATNIGAAKLTTLVSTPSGISSTTNAAAATGGQDDETASAFTSRAPTAFATRDVACTAADYATFAERVLGTGSRVKARSQYNGVTATNGYVTAAMLSPTWTSSSSITAGERAAVVRDIAGRTSGGVFVDAAVIIDKYDGTVTAQLPVFCVYRKSGYSENTVRANIAAAVNSYLSPATYPWEPDSYVATGYRPVYPTDLVQVVEGADGVDRVETRNGVPAVGMNYQTSAAAMTFVNGATAVTGIGGTDNGRLVADQSWIVDSVLKQAYLIVDRPSGSTATLDRAWTGASGSPTSIPEFTTQDTALSSWYSLPYANLSVSLTAPAASIIVVGVV